MARRRRLPPLRSAGGAWGRLRVSFGVSLSELHRRTGIPTPTLSLMEQGRTVPTTEQFEAVWKALGGPRPGEPISQPTMLDLSKALREGVSMTGNRVSLVAGEGEDVMNLLREEEVLATVDRVVARFMQG